MKRAALGALLVVAGYLAGTLAPHARADLGTEGYRAVREIVGELRGIRAELQQLRRAVEQRK